MTFGTHGSFYLREGWIFKILENWDDNRNIFSSEDAPLILGVGKNMVSSLRFWALATGIVSYERGHNVYSLTEFGKILQKIDPYIENDQTAWLLHLHIVSNMSYSTSWYWMFNEAPQSSFHANQFIELIQPWIDKNYKKAGISKPIVSQHTLKRDLQCLISTYTAKASKNNPDDNLSSPLSRLDLLRYEENIISLNTINDTMLSDKVFEYALALFLSKRKETNWLEFQDDEEKVQIGIWELTHEPYSPLKTLRITHQQLFDRMQGLNNLDWKINIQRTAGLDAINFYKVKRPNEVLQDMFNGG